MDGNKLEIVRVRVKVDLPGQKWTNRKVVMTKAGDLVAVLPITMSLLSLVRIQTDNNTPVEDVDPDLVAILPETDYTENMTLVEDEHWSKGLSDMERAGIERATEVDPAMDDLGW